MKADPILEEVWQIKDRLAEESGYDIRRFFEQLREWSEAHPHAGPVLRNAEEVHSYYEEKDVRSLMLREDPPESGPKQD